MNRVIKMFLIKIIVCILFISCDRSHYMDMYVINKCSENIEVITHRNYVGNEVWNYEIVPNMECKINYAEIIFPIKRGDIPVFFERLEIKKKGIEININSLDTNYWNFEIISKDNAFKGTYYRSKATLIVYDEYFE